MEVALFVAKYIEGSNNSSSMVTDMCTHLLFGISRWKETNNKSMLLLMLKASEKRNQTKRVNVMES